jgi:hypothetical protein
MGIPEPVANSLLLLTSNKVDDLDTGRLGMGTALHTLVSYLVTKIDLPAELLATIPDADISVAVGILDSLFLGCVDPNKAKDKFLSAIPDFAKLLLGNLDENVRDLLVGLVCLF